MGAEARMLRTGHFISGSVWSGNNVNAIVGLFASSS